MTPLSDSDNCYW